MRDLNLLAVLDRLFGRLHDRVLTICCGLTGKDNFWLARCALGLACGASLLAVVLWILSAAEGKATEAVGVASYFSFFALGTSWLTLRWIRVVETRAKRHGGGAAVSQLSHELILVRVGLEVAGYACGATLLLTSNSLSVYSTAALMFIFLGLAAVLYFVDQPQGKRKSVFRRGLEWIKRQRVERAGGAAYPMPT
ncbi:MAG TPA: hypothetical protein VMR75_03700 [Candidatus Saccharimonadales bacterium]|nr:hypothetical protein [Candidatus Saccharimonadales bacterium]